MGQVIILGAKGRFGRAAAQAFRAAGWDVTEAARNWASEAQSPKCIEVDVRQEAELAAACHGKDVIVNAVHPPYHHWTREVPKITQAVIAAARSSGASVILPGNVYNYGNDLPPVLREATPWVGNTRKGAIRIRMEHAYRDAGVRTIVLRGGDFIEAERSGNWFDTHIAHKAWAGKLTYPGPRDQVHAWAYLPDFASACVQLAERRDRFQAFEEFGFPGFSLTGHALSDLVGRAVGHEMKVSRFPWFALYIMSLWSPLIREVLEMRYLWSRPHRIDGTKLNAALPDFVPTAPEVAIAAALAPHGPAARTDGVAPVHGRTT